MEIYKKFEAFLNSSGELQEFKLNWDKEDLIVRITNETDKPSFQDFLDDIDHMIDEVIVISFWNPDGTMFDGEPISFPEISSCDEVKNFDDAQKGSLFYLGDKKIPELKKYFRNLGFNVSNTHLPDY